MALAPALLVKSSEIWWNLLNESTVNQWKSLKKTHPTSSDSSFEPKFGAGQKFRSNGSAIDSCIEGREAASGESVVGSRRSLGQGADGRAGCTVFPCVFKHGWTWLNRFQSLSELNYIGRSMKVRCQILPGDFSVVSVVSLPSLPNMFGTDPDCGSLVPWRPWWHHNHLCASPGPVLRLLQSAESAEDATPGKKMKQMMERVEHGKRCFSNCLFHICFKFHPVSTACSLSPMHARSEVKVGNRPSHSRNQAISTLRRSIFTVNWGEKK